MIEGLDYSVHRRPNIVNTNFKIPIFVFALALAASPAFAADDAANEARFITNARQLIFEGSAAAKATSIPMATC